MNDPFIAVSVGVTSLVVLTILILLITTGEQKKDKPTLRMKVRALRRAIKYLKNHYHCVLEELVEQRQRHKVAAAYKRLINPDLPIDREDVEALGPIDSEEEFKKICEKIRKTRKAVLQAAVDNHPAVKQIEKP